MSNSMQNNFCYGGQVQANGIRQHYLRYGGTGGGRDQHGAVVIIPGITSPAVTWGFVGERFGQCFDTYILDVRGRGLTEAGPALDYSVDAQAADVVAFVAALGLPRVSLVGHSMGARIATRALASQAAKGQQQGFAERLVMVDPPVSGPGRRAYPSKLPWYVDSMAAARQGIDAEGMRAFCPTWTDEQLQLRAQWLHTCNPDAIVRSFNDFHDDDFHLDLPAVKLPALLLTAERGDVVLDADVQEMRGLIAGLEHYRVPDAGHMVPWDNEEGFYHAFGDFLGATLPTSNS